MIEPTRKSIAPESACRDAARCRRHTEERSQRKFEEAELLAFGCVLELFHSQFLIDSVLGVRRTLLKQADTAFHEKYRPLTLRNPAIAELGVSFL
jgi:hypothetical protein